MRSTDFGSITSPAILGGLGRRQAMARGGRAASPSRHHVLIVAPSPVMGALMAAMLLHQGKPDQKRRGALDAALAKKKR